MNGLSAGEVTAYMSAIHSIRRACTIYDMHVHPYEVLFDQFSYEEHPSAPGMASIPGKAYTSPEIAALDFPDPPPAIISPKSLDLRKISLMQLRGVYGSIGKKVFSDHMDLSGVDRALLLPVASDPETLLQRMRWVGRLYGNEERFCMGGSIPGDLGAPEIAPYVAALRKEFGIRAMKCHPVVTGIDLGLKERREWLCALLEACRKSALPLIIHTGRHLPYWGEERGNFGTLENLKGIDWSAAAEPVVLAHAGSHLCSIREIGEEILPVLTKMLQRHSNLYVDISGIGLGPLKMILKAVEAERILFGSDALYVQQSRAVAMTMHTLKELGMPVEENFIKFASINPRRAIFRDGEECSPYSKQDGASF